MLFLIILIVTVRKLLYPGTVPSFLVIWETRWRRGRPMISVLNIAILEQLCDKENQNIDIPRED